LEGRVVGGVDAYAGQFPHQISLRQSGSHICGGSVIAHDYILTAAHCVSDQLENGTVLVIRAGTLDRFAGGMLINVAEVRVHEKYNSFWNDVALLKLAEPLIYSGQLRPIPLATAETPVDSDVIISGWGRLTTGGDVPRSMQWNTLSSISRLSCTTAIGVFRESMLCLAHEAGNGACNGDSGGPAIFNGEIVGIAGFVVDGCGSANPDGYAKVFYHRDWIIKHANFHETYVDVAAVKVHPKYNGGGVGYDLAVLRLKSNLNFNANMGAIALARSDPPTNSSVYISGWGAIYHGGPISKELLYIQVLSISRAQCTSRYMRNLPECTMCLLHGANLGACHGDSGGPAVYNDELVGVASFVLGGCGREAPDGYERVAFLRNWIVENAEL
ncbi:hypothetical protein KR093_002386, partial [Drosophila rubida]